MIPADLDTPAGQAHGALDGILVAINQGLVDFPALHEWNEAHGLRADPDRRADFVLYLRERMIQGLKAAERFVMRAEVDDPAALMVGYRLGHGHLEDDDDSPGRKLWACFFDIDLNDGRMIGTELFDPVEIRQLAAALLDQADAIEAHAAGRKCEHER